jgi:PDZ domain-containing protein
MKRIVTIAAVLVALGAAFVAGWVRLPYYALGPGPAREVTPLISFSGHERFPSDGRLVMTTVRYRQLTAVAALFAWLDPHQSIVREDVLFPPGQTRDQEDERSRSQMDQSKIDAAYVVLRDLLDYPKERGTGALIEQVVPGCPAEGMLAPGDVVLGIDGERVRSGRQASQLLDAVPEDQAIEFRVESDNETTEVSLERADCGLDLPLVGITMIDAFPIDLQISSGDIGGPSAGLMWAIGLYELLTPGDLTDGRTIAGTGTIDTEGNVGPIGGIEDKVVAAERAGADVVLAPVHDLRRLGEVDTGDMRLVPVTTFAQALSDLGVHVSAEPS